MEPQEIDSALDELENRLDRLRSLYEQYFLGIEKIEPQVARKDVDRRFWIMRRTQIRNTARRFRMQTLIQRYNTFQQHWARICREIENGTYVRHLIRAQKNLGAEPKTWAAKKRLGLLRRDRLGAIGASEADGAPGTDAPSELGAMLDSGAALGHEAGRAASEASVNAERPAHVTSPAGAKPAVPVRALEDLGPLDSDFDDDLAPPPVKQATRPVAAAATAAPATRAGVVPLPRAKPAGAPSETRNAEKPLPAPAPAGGLSEDRVRQLHGELLAAKRQLNQGENVSMEALAKSLRATESKLRAQHQGRAIDFQIVVKDGKPVVKPVVRR